MVAPAMSDRTPDEFFSELHELAGANDPKQFIKDCFWLIYSYPDVCIFDAVEAQGKKYALAFDCSPMDHEDEEYASTGGFTLQCLSENAASTKYSDQNGWPGEDSDWTTISIPGTEDEQDNGTSSGGKSIEAVFMPLGWLVEIDTQSSPPQRYVTNYSVLLNLSTKSVSLWLAYDYHPKDEDDILTTRTLSPSHIVNPAYHPYDPCPKLNQNGPFQGSEFKLVEKPAFRQQFLGASRVPLLKSQQVQRRPSNIQWHTDNSAVIARAKLLRLYGGTLLAENISDLFEIFGKASVHENAHTLLQQPYFNLLLPNERELVKIYTQVGTGQELRARLKKERESALVEKRTPCYGKRRFDKPGNHKEFPYELKMSGSGWEDDVIEQQSKSPWNTSKKGRGSNH